MNLLDAFKQYIKDAMPGGALNPEVSTQGVLDTAALATTPVPFLGDAIGLAADVKRLKDNPKERTPVNFASAGLGVLPFVPGMAGMTKAAKAIDALRPPQADALETARKNAVTMLGLPPNNTPMDRAKVLGFDVDGFHATGNDFRSFQVNPYRGAVSVAATPSGAVSGAKAGQADMTGTGATSVMPLLMRSEGVQGLRLPADQERFLGSLPKVASESQVDDLMKSAPKGSYWGNFFNEVENADGSFSYVRKDAPKVSFQDVQKTKRGADGAALPNWGDELWSANRQKEIGGKGWLQADEAGISASIVDPSILRSRFAAFDPARINENDLLGRADLGLLGLLAGGAAGAAYLTSDKDR